MGFLWKRAWVGVALLTLVAAGCKNNSASSIPVITTQPTNQTVTVPAAATFSVVASGPGTLMYQWYVNGVAIVGATSATYTTPLTSITNNGEFFFVFVSNEFGSVESDEVALTVNGQTMSSVRVLTLGNDPERSGENLQEQVLAPGTVNTNAFGKIGTFATDAPVTAQPLYLSNVSVPNVGARNIVYAATANNSIYGFDAVSGAAVWQANLNGANETAGDALSCNGSAAASGITSTPVIDAARGPHGAIYVVTMSKTDAGAYVQRLHALDAATGAEMFGGPSEIQPATSVARTALTNSSSTAFDPAHFAAHAGLLIAGNQVYVSWTSMCGGSADRGWVMAFDTSSLRITNSQNLASSSTSPLAPSAESLAADAAGNIFVNGIAADLADAAGRVHSLAISADSEGDIFLLSRGALGTSSTASVYQQIAGALSGSGANPVSAYFNSSAYFSAPGDRLKAFAISDARIAGIPSTESAMPFASTPAGISISVRGTQSAIVWLTEIGSANEPAILHAFDATNLSRELFNSGQAAKNRDAIGAMISSVPPTIANGRVFVATSTGLAVFGPRQ